jgi:hypothetical protein
MGMLLCSFYRSLLVVINNGGCAKTTISSMVQHEGVVKFVESECSTTRQMPEFIGTNGKRDIMTVTMTINGH